MSVFDVGKFVNPPKSARPMVRWWWPGLDVDRDELLREVADMDAANLAGGEIQAFCDGVPAELKNDPAEKAKLHRYRTAYYFDIVSDILAEMEKRGMILDLTACSGWPTNGTDVPLAQGQKHMYMYAIRVEGGKTREITLPTVDDLLAYRQREKENSPKPAMRGPFGGGADDTEELRKDLRLVGVSAAKCEGEPVDVVMTHASEKTGMLTHPVNLWDNVSDGKIVWDFPEGEWQVFFYFAGPNGNTSHMASREEIDKPNYIIDHFGKDIVYPYLDRHIGKGGWGKYAGKTLRAFFTDSFELSSPWTWTEDFFTEFENRRGYDLRPYLMATAVPGNDSMFSKMMGLKTPPMYDLPDGVGDRVRYDYQLTIADLFDDYFMGALKAWGDDNNMKNRVQCYGHSMDNLKAFGRTHIPETEQLAGNGVIDFLKLAGSASLNYQLPLATSESLVWLGHDYMTTPTKMKIAADKLFVSGVNQLIYHGMPYRHPDWEFPHFYPFHGSFGSFICRDNTLWSEIGGMNARIARGQTLMQSGNLMCDVAVYYQKLDYVSGSEALEELTAGVLPGFDRSAGLSSGHGGQNGQPSPEQARGNSDFRLSHILMEAGYDYYFVNEECLLRGEMLDGCFVCGDARFKALVLNDEKSITIEAAYKLRDMMDAGFPVIFLDSVPRKVPGLPDNQKREAELNRIMDGVEAVNQDSVAAALAESGIEPTLVFDVGNLQHTRRALGDNTLWFVRSPSPDKFTAHIEMGDARLLMPETGEITMPIYENGRLVLPFAEYGSCFILAGDDLPAATGDAAYRALFAHCAENRRALDVEKWRFSGKNAVKSAADVEKTLTALTDLADDPDAKGFSGTLTYEGSFDWNAKEGGNAYLDLGKVGDAAEVTLNGSCLGEALTVPYVFDITAALKQGANHITIRVTNTLRNALVATDAFKGGMMIGGPGPRGLAMSGLIGPAEIVML